MKEPYELNEEELSSIAGGAACPGDRVVTIKVGDTFKLTVKESDLATWQARHPDKAGIAEYAHGTFLSRGEIKYDEP